MKANNIKKTLALTLGSVLAFGAVSFAGCSKGDSTANIPQLPDYSTRAKDFDFFSYSGPMSGLFYIDSVAEDYNADQRTKEGYTVYKEAGFNVLMLTGSAGFNGGDWEGSECQRCFAAATEAGIDRIIVTDSGIENYVKTTPIVGEGRDFATQEDLVEYVKTKVLEKYKDLPNFYGLRISDERTYEYTESVGSLYRALKQAAKEMGISDNLYIHLNILPISEVFERFAPYKPSDNTDPNVVGESNIEDAYRSYIRGYIEACQPDRLSSDVYLYRDKGLAVDFFPTIQILRSECDAYGVDVSFCLQSFEMYNRLNRNYRAVGKSEMKGELYALMGMGVDDFAYFTYQVMENTTTNNVMTDGATFLTRSGEKTNVYYAGQDVMSEAQKISDVILNYEYQGGKFYKKDIATFDNSFTSSQVDDKAFTSASWDNSHTFALLKDVTFDNDVVFTTELYDEVNGLYMYMLQNIIDPNYGAVGRTAETVTATFDSSYTYVAEFDNGNLSYVKLNKGVYTKTLAAGHAVYLIPLK